MRNFRLPFSAIGVQVVVLGIACLMGISIQSATADEQEKKSEKESPAIDATPVGYVGVALKINQVLLPGTKLEVAPVSDRNSPMMLRLVEVWPHGDSFRYDFEVIGLEPGEYDLKKFLVRQDRSEIGELPSIPVRIQTVLPEGHIIPNEIPHQWPRIARYRPLAILTAVAWSAGLIGLILWNRKRALQTAELAHPRTFADMIAPRLTAAMSGELNTSQLAELERFIVEFWRRRLKMSDVPVNRAISQLREHAEAGPLLVQLETWIHNRPGSSNGTKQSDLAKLLEPYQKFPAEQEAG